MEGIEVITRWVQVLVFYLQYTKDTVVQKAVTTIRSSKVDLLSSGTKDDD